MKEVKATCLWRQRLRCETMMEALVEYSDVETTQHSNEAAPVPMDQLLEAINETDEETKQRISRVILRMIPKENPKIKTVESKPVSESKTPPMSEFAKHLDEMRNVDIRTVDPDTLVDITQIKIDSKLPRIERIKDYMQKVKNPYCIKVGKTVVKISFADTNRTFEDCLQHYIKGLKGVREPWDGI